MSRVNSTMNGNDRYFLPRYGGHTLAEVLMALIVAAAVLTAVLAVHGRVQQSAEAIEKDLGQFSLPQEVLQLIAEDLDNKIVPKTDAGDNSEANTRVQLYSKYDNGFSVAQLKITTTMKDEQWDDRVMEEIIWQADVDPFTNRIVLYRSHSGLILEDKLLDQKRDPVEKFYPFVPVCGGLSLFRVEARVGENWVLQWTGDALPTGIRVTLSDAEPHRTVQGQWEVDEEDLMVRTMAIDRTRKIKFVVPDPNLELEGGADVL